MPTRSRQPDGQVSHHIFKGLLLFGILAIVILVSGCVSIKLHTKINKDGVIENYGGEITMNSVVYSIMEEQAKKDGYSSVKEGFSDSFQKATGGVGTCNEKWNDDKVTIVCEAKNFKAPCMGKSIEVCRKGDYLVFKEYSVAKSEQTKKDELSESVWASIRVDYYLEMPGKIVESNADVVKGNKAEWHFTGANSPDVIYAKSEVPKVPGFGVLAGIFGLGGAGLVLRNMLKNRGR